MRSTLALLALLLTACNTPPAPTITPVPSVTPTPFSVAVLPTTEPGTLPPPPSRPPPDQSPLPPDRLAVGAPVFRLPDSSPDQIRSIVLNPAAPELLILLYDGMASRTLRVRWQGASQPIIEPLPGEWVQPNYAPDGKRIIANGLRTFDFATARTEGTPDEAAFAPKFDPAGKLVYLRKLPPEQCAGQGTPEDLKFCAGIVIGDGQPEGARPYLSGPAEVSPDGKALLLTTAGEVGSTLVVYRLDTRDYVQIVPNPNFGITREELLQGRPDPNSFISAIWSADSRKIYYISQSFELFEVDAVGSRPTPLGGATHPHLQKGTDYLYYLRPLDGGFFEMWRRNTVGGANERVSDAAFHCASATWSADGATLACVDVINDERAVILYAVPQT